jgi:hypothetical protein
MKKLLVTGIGLLAAASIWAQGTVNFFNQNPIRDIDGTTALGSGFKADLYWAPATGAVGEVSPAGSTFTSGGILTVTFGGAVPAGNFFGGVKGLAGTALGQTVWVQLRAFPATFANWQAAYNAGANVSPDALAQNGSIRIGLGNPSAVPAVPAASIIALPSHNLIPVPEPSTILLGLAGIGGLLFLRRKMA